MGFLGICSMDTLSCNLDMLQMCNISFCTSRKEIIIEIGQNEDVEMNDHTFIQPEFPPAIYL